MRHVVTSLKHSLRSLKQNIAAFFNGSSENGVSRNTPAEIYRSLLVQVLRTHSFQEDALELMDTQESKLLLSQEVQAHHQELFKVLESLFRKPRLEKIIMLNEAVDKCIDPDELMQFFQDIAPTISVAKLKIYLPASRRSP